MTEDRFTDRPSDTLPGVAKAPKTRAREIVLHGGRLEVRGPPASELRVAPEVQLIGRAAGCALSLHDPTVSRVHAEVQATTEGVLLRDRGSTNGTFVGSAGRELRVQEVHLTRPCVGRFGNCP